jgi:hypothetical protein
MKLASFYQALDIQPIRRSEPALQALVARSWGDGTSSSSDGLHMSVGVKAANDEYSAGRGTKINSHAAGIQVPFGNQSSPYWSPGSRSHLFVPSFFPRSFLMGRLNQSRSLSLVLLSAHTGFWENDAAVCLGRLKPSPRHLADAR